MADHSWEWKGFKMYIQWMINLCWTRATKHHPIIYMLSKVLQQKATPQFWLAPGRYQQENTDTRSWHDLSCNTNTCSLFCSLTCMFVVRDKSHTVFHCLYSCWVKTDSTCSFDHFMMSRAVQTMENCMLIWIPVLYPQICQQSQEYQKQS